MDWLHVLAGPAGLTAIIAMLISYVRYANQKRGEFEELARGHDECELVDIRSDAFKPNELVATLCITHDEQLGPEVWQRKMDRELVALEAPKAPSKTSYVDIDPAIQAPVADLKQKIQKEAEAIGALSLMDDPRYCSPMRSWTADDFRRWGWEPSFKQSNFDHSLQAYVLPFYRERGARTWNTYKLEFHNEAAAQGWWRSSVSYNKYREQREAIQRFRLPGRP